MPDDVDLPFRKEDFRDVARTLRASRDIGAQLFCAFLRAAGVETRLVCSLQALPIGGSAKVVASRKQRQDMYIMAELENQSSASENDDSGDEKRKLIGSIATAGQTSDPSALIRSKLSNRLKRPLLTSERIPTPSASTSSSPQKSTYIYPLSAMGLSSFPCYGYQLLFRTFSQTNTGDSISCILDRSIQFRPPKMDSGRLFGDQVCRKSVKI